MLRLLVVLLLNLSLLWPLQPAMASGSYLEKTDYTLTNQSDADFSGLSHHAVSTIGSPVGFEQATS